MEISILAAAGLIAAVLAHRRALQINRRDDDLPGPERGCATASADALRPGQAHVRTVQP